MANFFIDGIRERAKRFKILRRIWVSVRYFKTKNDYRFLFFTQRLKIRLARLFLRDRIKKIYLWRPGGIGDTLMLDPLARGIKGFFPKAKVVYVGDHVEIAQRLPAFDEVIGTRGGCHLPQFNKFRRRASRLNSLILHPFYETIFYGGAPRALLKLLHSSLDLRPAAPTRLAYRLTYEESQLADEYKKKLGDYIIIVSDAKPFTKRYWAYDNWQKLIDMQTLPVIMVGTGHDLYGRCVDLRNRISIHQCAALIEKCRLFIGIVGGLSWFTHIFKKDAIIINGGCEPPAFMCHQKSRHLTTDVECSPCLMPWEICPFGMKCMKMIEPEMVNEKVREALNKL